MHHPLKCSSSIKTKSSIGRIYRGNDTRPNPNATFIIANFLRWETSEVACIFESILASSEVTSLQRCSSKANIRFEFFFIETSLYTLTQMTKNLWIHLRNLLPELIIWNITPILWKCHKKGVSAIPKVTTSTQIAIHFPPVTKFLQALESWSLKPVSKNTAYYVTIIYIKLWCDEGWNISVAATTTTTSSGRYGWLHCHNATTTAITI